MTTLSRPMPRTRLAMTLAGVLLAAGNAAHAQTPFSAPDKAYKGQVQFAAVEGRAITAGHAVAVSGQGFAPGRAVSLYYGATPLAGGPLTANAEGRIQGRLTVPAGAAVGVHPIVVVTSQPYNAAIAELKVSPDVPLSSEAGFRVVRAAPAPGLYQTAYSARNKAIFLTSAVGRPPVRVSELLKLDAETLAVQARVTPPPAPPRQGRAGADADAGVYAVYGVGVDDVHDNVWVTNSRQNTVAVYRQSDLSLVRQFEPGVVNHARDVVVDQSLNKAFASATFEPEVVVFDTSSNTELARIVVASKVRGGKFSAASLSLDAQRHRLYVVSNSTNEVALIDTRTNQVEQVLPVPGAKGTIGVSHDPKTGRIFVAAQGSDNLVVLDGESGAVLADTPVGAGALNVVFDPVSNRAFVSNFGAGTVTVTDVNGRIVANLGPIAVANHVSTDGRGSIFVARKTSWGGGGAGNDTVERIRPIR